MGNACGWLGSECNAAEQTCGRHSDTHGHAAQRMADATDPPRLHCRPLPTLSHLLHEPAPNRPCERGPVEHWYNDRFPQHSPCAPTFLNPCAFPDSSCAAHGIQHASPHGCEAGPPPPWQRARPGAHCGGLPGSIFCQDQALAMQQQLLHAVDKVSLQPAISINLIDIATGWCPHPAG